MICATYEYPNRVASQAAMNDAVPARGELVVFHYTDPGCGPRILALGEAHYTDQLSALRKVLTGHGGFEVPSDPEHVERLRARLQRPAT